MKRYGICILAVFAAMTAWAGEPIDQSIEAEEGATILVENVAGLVRITGWDRPEVKVTGELGDGADRVVVSAEYGRVLVRVLMPRSSTTADTELIVNAPASSPLVVETVSADIEVSAMNGSQRLKTVSGNVTTFTAGDDLEVKSAAGDITINGDGTTSDATIASVSGDVLIDGVTGEVNAKSVSGDVLLQGTGITQARLSSTSGDLRLAGSVNSDPQLVLESISGDTTIEIDGDLSGEFDLKTTSGEIKTCFGLEPDRDEYGAGQSLRHTEDEGEAQVRVKTMSGDISICRN
ncbi:MAG: DUF4097 domain-containing protein [Gammaproteobacteria bacterium]|nr:DUF4097 domain-containing protein [Gammaproteobacteria bacterium]